MICVLLFSLFCAVCTKAQPMSGEGWGFDKTRQVTCCSEHMMDGVQTTHNRPALRRSWTLYNERRDTVWSSLLCQYIISHSDAHSTTSENFLLCRNTICPVVALLEKPTTHFYVAYFSKLHGQILSRWLSGLRTLAGLGSKTTTTTTTDTVHRVTSRPVASGGHVPHQTFWLPTHRLRIQYLDCT